MKIIIELVETDYPMYCERVNHALEELLTDEKFRCGIVEGRTFKSTVRGVETTLYVTKQED